jgi:hypothetical protein
MGTRFFRVWGLAVGLSLASGALAHDKNDKPKSCGEGSWLRIETTGYDVRVEPPAQQTAGDAGAPDDPGACYKVSPGKYTVKFLKGGVVKGTVGAHAVPNRTKVVRFKK